MILLAHARAKGTVIEGGTKLAADVVSTTEVGAERIEKGFDDGEGVFGTIVWKVISTT